MTTDVNRWLDKGIATREVLDQVSNIFSELAGDVLGVVRDPAAGDRSGSAEREAALIEMMIHMRADARKAKDFARADEIRTRLTEIGVTLEDGPKGTSWRVG
jgi:cysteinyl-tRNA synthetase